MKRNSLSGNLRFRHQAPIHIKMTEEKPLNPWFSIWLRPRATIQQIVDTNPTRLVLVLVVLAGLPSVFEVCSKKTSLPTSLFLSFILGPLLGIIILYIGGALLHLTGRWLGGLASPQNIRAALAWSNVPIIWALLLWIPKLSLFWSTSDVSFIDNSDPVGFILLEKMIGIWSFVILLKCLGQVQGFSVWRALGNSILAALFFLIIVVVVAQLLVLIIFFIKLIPLLL